MEKELESSFANILIYGMYADDMVSKKETKLFCSLMKKNFFLSEEESLNLLKNTHPTSKDIEGHIEKINELLQDKPSEKMMILEYLNHILYTDGIKVIEYTVFEQLKEKLFPTVQEH